MAISLSTKQRWMILSLLGLFVLFVWKMKISPPTPHLVRVQEEPEKVKIFSDADLYENQKSTRGLIGQEIQNLKISRKATATVLPKGQLADKKKKLKRNPKAKEKNKKAEDAAIAEGENIESDNALADVSENADFEDADREGIDWDEPQAGVVLGVVDTNQATTSNWFEQLLRDPSEANFGALWQAYTSGDIAEAEFFGVLQALIETRQINVIIPTLQLLSSVQRPQAFVMIINEVEASNSLLSPRQKTDLRDSLDAYGDSLSGLRALQGVLAFAESEVAVAVSLAILRASAERDLQQKDALAQRERQMGSDLVPSEELARGRAESSSSSGLATDPRLNFYRQLYGLLRNRSDEATSTNYDLAWQQFSLFLQARLGIVEDNWQERSRWALQ